LQIETNYYNCLDDRIFLDRSTGRKVSVTYGTSKLNNQIVVMKKKINNLEAQKQALIATGPINSLEDDLSDEIAEARSSWLGVLYSGSSSTNTPKSTMCTALKTQLDEKFADFSKSITGASGYTVFDFFTTNDTAALWAAIGYCSPSNAGTWYATLSSTDATTSNALFGMEPTYAEMVLKIATAGTKCTSGSAPVPSCSVGTTSVTCKLC
jgi:hypothetical protein